MPITAYAPGRRSYYRELLERRMCAYKRYWFAYDWARNFGDGGR